MSWIVTQQVNLKGVPIHIIFKELSVARWHDFWWRRVVSFWIAIVGSDSASICSIVLQDAIALAQAGCKFGWAAQVFGCFERHGKAYKAGPLVKGAPIRKGGK